MELNELDAILEKTAVPPADGEWAEDVDPEDQAIIDIKEAIALFSTVKTILDYVGNVNICRTLTKRERDIMFRVSEEVRNYLAAVEPTYNDEEEDA